MIEQLNQIHNQLVSEGKDEAADLIAQAIVALGGAHAQSGGNGSGNPPKDG